MNIAKMQTQTNKNKDATATETPNKIDYTKIAKELGNNNKYKCAPWLVNNQVFKIPTNIEFKDLTIDLEKMQESAKKIKESAEQMKQNACNLCDSLPDEAKNQCLANCK